MKGFHFAAPWSFATDTANLPISSARWSVADSCFLNLSISRYAARTATGTVIARNGVVIILSIFSKFSCTNLFTPAAKASFSSMSFITLFSLLITDDSF